jgi:hypothetical protein
MRIGMTVTFQNFNSMSLQTFVFIFLKIIPHVC